MAKLHCPACGAFIGNYVYEERIPRLIEKHLREGCPGEPEEGTDGAD